MTYQQHQDKKQQDAQQAAQKERRTHVGFFKNKRHIAKVVQAKVSVIQREHKPKSKF